MKQKKLILTCEHWWWVHGRLVDGRYVRINKMAVNYFHSKNNSFVGRQKDVPKNKRNTFDIENADGWKFGETVSSKIGLQMRRPSSRIECRNFYFHFNSKVLCAIVLFHQVRIGRIETSKHTMIDFEMARKHQITKTISWRIFKIQNKSKTIVNRRRRQRIAISLYCWRYQSTAYGSCVRVCIYIQHKPQTIC